MNIVEQVPCTPSERAKGQAAYAIEKTPHDVADLFEAGALREGGAPNVWSRQHIGLLMQYAAVGMIHGTLSGTVYPFFLNYLNMEGTQVVSARVLLNLPWSFKVFYGLLSDCVPIFGYRRRPFMLIGWTVCFFMLLVMACMDAGDPYYPDRKYAHVNPATLNPEIVATFNTSARQNGAKFIVAMMLATVGCVGADVAADAVVVELAQREPEAVRGTTQTTIYMVRTIFVTLSAVLTGVAFNGKDYGGDFDFSISFPQLMLILCLCCLPVLPITWFFIKEEKHAGVNVREYMASFWELLQQQPVYQVIAYSFFSGIFAKFTATCLEPMQATWAGSTPFNDKVMEMAGHSIFALTIFCIGKYGLHWNWRLMVLITAVAVVVMDSMVTLLTTWNVVRNQWFWLGVGVAESLPSGIGFIIGTFVTVELAGQGNEGAVYGLLSTVNNLAAPFASTLSKNVDAKFDVKNEDIVLDSTHVRWEVTYVLLIRYAANLMALLFLPLLPKQKAQTQELKRKGVSSRVLGAITVAYLAFALFWSVMVNVMSIYPATACLKLVGGSGCK